MNQSENLKMKYLHPVVMTLVLFFGFAISSNGIGFSNSASAFQDEGPKAPVDVNLRAKDGFNITATWYEGSKGKDAAAIIMLHDLGRDSRDYANLAAYYASNGHCVIVPDLRGNGRSTVDPTGAEYKPDRFSKGDLIAMQADIEACKKFLIQKNDEEICNIEYLMVVTDGAAALPALGWSVLDWSFLPTTTKNGQDVKGLVMLNPERNYRGLSVTEALRAPLISGKNAANPLDIMIVVGSGNRGKFRDAKGMFSTIANTRGRRKDDEENFKEHDIFLKEVPSSALHEKFFAENPDTVPEYTLDLLEFRILNNDSYAWKKRKVD